MADNRNQATGVMKQVILFIFLATALLGRCSGIDSTRTFLNLAKHFDPGRYLGTEKTADAFWRQLANGNVSLKQLKKGIEKHSEKSRLSMIRYESLPSMLPDKNSVFISESTLTDSLLETAAKLSGFSPDMAKLVLLEHPWPATSTVPVRRGGFITLINTGMVDDCKKLCGDSAVWVLTAILAREYAHGLLLHHLQKIYSEESKHRRFYLWRTVSDIFLPTRYAFDEYYREKHRQEQLERTATASSQLLNIDSEASWYWFDYMHQSLIEADLACYRLMEMLGHPGACRRALELSPDPIETNFFSIDSPSESKQFRMAMIRFVEENPSLEETKRNLRKLERTTDPNY